LQAKVHKIQESDTKSLHIPEFEEELENIKASFETESKPLDAHKPDEEGEKKAKEA
jgi:hypothetical protein